MSNEPDLFSDRIHIEQLEISARVGVREKERAAPQRLTASITLWPQRQAEELHDHIAKTVNYSEVCEETKKFVRDHTVKLIETRQGLEQGFLLNVLCVVRVAGQPEPRAVQAGGIRHNQLCERLTIATARAAQQRGTRLPVLQIDGSAHVAPRVFSGVHTLG